MASDQRYCLECGERRAPASSFAPSAAPSGETTTPPPATPSRPPGSEPARETRDSANTPAVIAGVGVLLLAMGIGILIGRSGNAKTAAAAAPQVITVAGTSGSGGSTASSEESFTGDWPSSTSGYTVQLQTLPETGTTVSAVQAAKSSATGKGAKSVGALKSEEFTSLTAGSYVIYSGIYHKRAEATKALAGLKKNFPGAKVISVSSHGSAAEGSTGGSSGGVGSNESKPAPPSVLEGLKGAKGKSYEEKSKNLPDVVSTG
ncbi:MAG TPA: hypothetical protein VNR42_06135 [Solirubrobacteraceae bacterium]|nr:hypothetical protein [Solirubrobacteraceae bacterium]